MKRWERTLTAKPIAQRLIPASTGRGFTLTVHSSRSQPSRSKVAPRYESSFYGRPIFVYVSVPACRARGMGGGER